MEETEETGSFEVYKDIYGSLGGLNLEGRVEIISGGSEVVHFNIQKLS